MAHTAKRISIGFEPIYNKTVTTIPNAVKYELKPDTAFAKGEMVALANGRIQPAVAASVANIVGVMAHAVAKDDNPSAGLTFGAVYDHPDNVYRATFVDHRDAVATGGTTAQLADSTLTTTNDFFNGAALYIYEGPAAGSLRTVNDTVAIGGILAVSNPFPVAPTAESKYILLGGGSEDGDYINVGFGGILLKDSKTIDANADAFTAATGKAGPLVCVGLSSIADLMMDVMIRRSCHIFG